MQHQQVAPLNSCVVPDRITATAAASLQPVGQSTQTQRKREKGRRRTKKKRDYGRSRQEQASLRSVEPQTPRLYSKTRLYFFAQTSPRACKRTTNSNSKKGSTPNTARLRSLPPSIIANLAEPTNASRPCLPTPLAGHVVRPRYKQKTITKDTCSARNLRNQLPACLSPPLRAGKDPSCRRSSRTSSTCSNPLTMCKPYLLRSFLPPVSLVSKIAPP